MINLSELRRSSGSLSFFQRISSHLDPDQYFASDVAEFKAEGPHLPFPRHKYWRAPYSPPRAYIRLHQVRVTSVHLAHGGPGWYTVEDASGLSLMNWAGHDLLGKLQSPADAARDEGYEDGDQVFEVCFQYLIEENLPSIIWIMKHPRILEPTEAPDAGVSVFPLRIPQFE